MTTVVTITQPPITKVTTSEQVVTVNIVPQPPTAVTIASGVRTLVNLSDVAITTPTDDQVLTYDDVTGKWVNQSVIAIAATDVSNLTTATGNAGEMVDVAPGGGLRYQTPAQVLTNIGAETAGAAAAVQSNLNTHTGDLANPHVVTPTQLGLVIGTNVQAFHQNLADIAGLAPGVGTDGYSITWDNTAGAFVLTEITGGGGGTWGSITGTLSDQTDLNTALNARVADTGDTMTGALKINANSTTAFFVERDGVNDDTFIVDTTNQRAGVGIVPTTTFHTKSLANTNNVFYLQSDRFSIQRVHTTHASFSANINVGYGTGGAGSARNYYFGTAPATGYLYIGTGTNGWHVVGDGDLIIVKPTGEVGIGAIPTAKLHVDQLSATGAQPVMKLNQADVSEQIFEITSTAGVGNAIELAGAKTLTTTHFIKITVNGNTRYIPAGTVA